MMKSKVLLFQSPDKPGIIAQIAQCLYAHQANIIEADQHSSCAFGGDFFLRIEFCIENPQTTEKALDQALHEVAELLQAHIQIFDLDQPLRTAILLSQQDHCLHELLYLWTNQELPITISAIISNHDLYRDVAEQHNIPFHHIDASDKEAAEQNILAITQKTDFLILARYMQILNPEFLKHYGRDIINIHHSFLPSFKGANPYQQAFDRGVKVIGASAHFVTSDLDEGPLISQLVKTVSHRDCIDTLKQKGRILEKQTLAQAVRAYAKHRVIRSGHKTIVFD